MPTAKVTKNVSAATGGGNVLCSTLISIKTKAWLYSLRWLTVPKPLAYTNAMGQVQEAYSECFCGKQP